MGCKYIGSGGMINDNRGPKGLFHGL
jgi:hypothetical protein